MNEGSPGDVVASFFDRLAEAGRGVLLLDYDGTLAPFSVVRDAVRPWPGIVPRLDAMMARARTRLVIVSGRPARDLPSLLPLARRPEVWGSHGRERWWADGRYDLEPPEATAARGLADARAWALAQAPSEAIEGKPASLALHWRGCSDAQAQALRHAAEAAWTPLAARAGLVLHAFDGGLELRAPGRDKGHALRAVIAEEPAGAPIAYLGDDHTDEDAFRALPSGGLGVLVRSEARPTAAHARIAPPQGLLDWLDAWAAALEDPRRPR